MSFQQSSEGRLRYRAALFVAAGAAVAATALIMRSGFLEGRFLDNDDLMRMLQVRELLDGRAWFDLHEPRLDPPNGLDSHWSRLIDGGIASLVLLFRVFVDRTAAEHAAQIVWPLLWIVPAVAFVAAAGRRLGGEIGGVAAAFHAAASFLPGLTQFRPGRIDHHNVQIVLALAVFAAVLGLDGSRSSGRRIGAAVCVLFAIGLESAPFALLGLGILALRFVSRGTVEEFRGACETIILLLPLLFLIQTPPHLLLRSSCDALGFNLTAGFVAAAAVGLIGSRLRSSESAAGRAGVAGAGAALAGSLLFGLDPRCLSGPFGAENPAIFPLWLAHNLEVQPIGFSLRADDLFLVTIAPPLAALVLLAVQARAKRLGPERAVVAALFLCLATAMALALVRNLPYPVLFASAVIGASIAGLAPLLQRFGAVRPMALGCIFIFSLPFPAGLMIQTVFEGNGSDRAAVENRPEAAPSVCDRPEAFTELAALPPTRVLSSLNMGTPILALTPHSVFAAPYHRASDAIVENIRLMDGPDEDVIAFMRRRGATLAVACKGQGRGFEKRLSEGPVEGLEEVPTRGPIGIWRLKP